MDITESKVVRKYKSGYEIREELWSMGSGDEPTPMRQAYTPSGDYIGSSKWAYKLCNKYGVKPEKNKSDHTVCSIGFSERDQKWYGWSHRAIYGFKIGDTVKEGDCCASSGYTEEYLKEHPEEDDSLHVGFVAKNTDDCKKMAVAFAESVS